MPQRQLTTRPSWAFAAYLLIGSLLVLGRATATQADVAPTRVQEIVRACENLVLDYASFRDQEQGAELAGLFTANGTLAVNGEQFSGRSELLARFQSPAKQTFRHMMSNIRITVEDEASASGVSYALIFVGAKTSGQPSSPIEVTNFVAMGEYHDVFRRTDEGWRIASRGFVPVFLPTQP